MLFTDTAASTIQQLYPWHSSISGQKAHVPLIIFWIIKDKVEQNEKKWNITELSPNLIKIKKYFLSLLNKHKIFIKAIFSPAPIQYRSAYVWINNSVLICCYKLLRTRQNVKLSTYLQTCQILGNFATGWSNSHIHSAW